jgi:hypothetical protein
MLTEDGFRNRFWRGYPHLRRLLESKEGPVPRGVDLEEFFANDEPRSSVNHGPLGRLAEVIAITRLLTRQGREIQDAMRDQASSAEGIADEVGQFLRELEERVHAFRRATLACDHEVDGARAVAHDVHELCGRLRVEGQVRPRENDGREKQ